MLRIGLYDHANQQVLAFSSQHTEKTFLVPYFPAAAVKKYTGTKRVGCCRKTKEASLCFTPYLLFLAGIKPRLVSKSVYTDGNVLQNCWYCRGLGLETITKLGVVMPKLWVYDKILDKFDVLYYLHGKDECLKHIST